MPIEVGRPISTPVDVVCTSLVPPVIARGRVTRFDGVAYDLEIEEPVPPVSGGSQVILDFSDSSNPRVIATVTEVQGRRIQVAERATSRPDKRTFPRLYGSVELSFRRRMESESDTAIKAWMGSGLEGAGGIWNTPDPFMNFSVTGLKFEAGPGYEVGETLLLSFTVPTSKSTFRCQARIARTLEIAGQEGLAERAHSVAVEFIDLNAEGREALSEFTLLIQGVLL